MKSLWFAFLTLISFILPAMDQPNEKTIDDLFQDFNQSDTPGAAVAVIQNGKMIFAKAYGLADLEKKIPCSVHSNFRLASVSKQFTAMAILTLVQNEKLALDDLMTKFIPEFPAYGRDITLRHLLTHTSGVPDYEDLTPAGTTIPLSDRDVLYLLRKQTKGDFAPGTKYHYSNSAYALLALIVEAASGETFPAYLRRHIFQPLGMENTLAYVPGISSVPNRAYGYAQIGEHWQFSDQSVSSAVLGDGGIYSSISDLFHWDQALFTEKLIGAKLLEEAFTIHSSQSDFANSGYGYGWYICKNCATRHVWHYGSTCGFRTKIERFPEKKLSFIILTNRRDADLDGLSQRLTKLYWPDEK